MSVQEKIDNLRESLVYLFEVRGELDEESNLKTELQIEKIFSEIADLQGA